MKSVAEKQNDSDTDQDDDEGNAKGNFVTEMDQMTIMESGFDGKGNGSDDHNGKSG